MKKEYIIPALSVIVTGQSLPIAASLTINNEAVNDMQGDAKSAGEWEDIWE